MIPDLSSPRAVISTTYRLIFTAATREVGATDDGRALRKPECKQVGGGERPRYNEGLDGLETEYSKERGDQKKVTPNGDEIKYSERREKWNDVWVDRER